MQGRVGMHCMISYNTVMTRSARHVHSCDDHPDVTDGTWHVNEGQSASHRVSPRQGEMYH